MRWREEGSRCRWRERVRVSKREDMVDSEVEGLVMRQRASERASTGTAVVASLRCCSHLVRSCCSIAVITVLGGGEEKTLYLNLKFEAF